MRASSIAIAALVAGAFTPTVASAAGEEEAHQSTTQVLFDGSKKMFRGNSLDYQWPQDSAIFLRAVVDTDFEVRLNMLGESQLDWNDATFEQRWYGITKGGVLTLDADFVMELSANIDPNALFGGGSSIPAFSYKIFDYDNEWSGEDEFDSLLLPATDGAPAPSSSVTVEPTDLLYLDAPDVEFAVPGSGGDWGVIIDIIGQVEPSASVTLTGVKVRSDGEDLTAMDQVLTLDAPSSNDGTVTYDALWEAIMDGKAGFKLIPTIEFEACTDWADADNDGDLECDFGFEFAYPYTIDLDEDLANFKTKPTDYDHDVPAIRSSANSVDLGTVEVNTSAEQEISITNLGELDLIGAARLEGDAVFGLAQPDVLALKGTPDAIVVTFTPQLAGSYTGTLIIETNDPIEPTISIPVSGTGSEPGIDGDTGDALGDSGEGGDLKGCGCSAAPAPGTAGLLGFALLGMLGFRRRQS